MMVDCEIVTEIFQVMIFSIAKVMTTAVTYTQSGFLFIKLDLKNGEGGNFFPYWNGIVFKFFQIKKSSKIYSDFSNPARRHTMPTHLRFHGVQNGEGGIRTREKLTPLTP